MKKNIILLIIVFCIILVYLIMKDTKDTEKAVINNADIYTDDLQIIPIQHASVMLSWKGNNIYIDPVQGNYDGRPLADIILLTDIHGDHLSADIISQLSKDETIIVAPQAVADLLSESLKSNLVILKNGEITTKKDFDIEAAPMYNLPESDDAYHVKGLGNGYIISTDNKRVYLSGDTGDIPEMRSLKDIDIAFVSMNLPYTMTVESAADAVLEFKPKQVYPYHYRGSDVNKFKEIVNNSNTEIEVMLLDWYPSL